MILIPADRFDEERDIISRIRRGERVDHFETIRQTKSGLPIPISVTISPITDESGKIIGASKVARDITPQLAMQEKLRDSEERYRTTLSSIGDAVIATDECG